MVNINSVKTFFVEFGQDIKELNNRNSDDSVNARRNRIKSVALKAIGILAGVAAVAVTAAALGGLAANPVGAIFLLVSAAALAVLSYDSSRIGHELHKRAGNRIRYATTDAFQRGFGQTDPLLKKTLLAKHIPGLEELLQR